MKLSPYSYLTIEHLRILLGYDDLRSVKLWCEKNGVFILKQGNATLVNGAEFMLSFYRPFIEHLKQKHSNWKERFINYIEGNLGGLLGYSEQVSRIAEPHMISTDSIQESFVEHVEVASTPLLYPKKERITGIYAYCQKCKTSIGSGKCQLTKKKIQSCDHPEFHTFRASVVIPGTGGQRRKKILNTTDIVEAVQKKKDFEQSLIEAPSHQNAPVVVAHGVEDENVAASSHTLTVCIKKFTDFLNDIGVPKHKMKKLSQGYIDDCMRGLGYFTFVLERNGLDPDIVGLEEINDSHVGWVHSYLLEERGFSNRSYNRNMGYYTALYAFCIETLKCTTLNPFKGVKRRKSKTQKTTISQKEFETFLSVIKPENGLRKYPKETKQHYRPWLSLAYRIALETGLRREEYIKLRFEDVHTDEEGIPVYIIAENYKVNRRGNLETEEEKEYKVVPVTNRMHDILASLDFEQHKGSSRYLIDPDGEASRTTMMALASRGFTQFWGHTGVDRKVEQKHLRKTYLTAVAEHFGDKAAIISSHSSMDVLTEHYVDDKALIERSRDFKVF